VYVLFGLAPIFLVQSIEDRPKFAGLIPACQFGLRSARPSEEPGANEREAGYDKRYAQYCHAGHTQTRDKKAALAGGPFIPACLLSQLPPLFGCGLERFQQPQSGVAVRQVLPSVLAVRNPDGRSYRQKRARRVFKIALVEIIEGSLLAPRDIFVARHVTYQGTIHFHLPMTVSDKSS
jgi:hypothetical protein